MNLHLSVFVGAFMITQWSHNYQCCFIMAVINEFYFSFFLPSKELFSIYLYIDTTPNRVFYFPLFISYFNRYIMFSQPLTVFYFEFPAIFWRIFFSSLGSSNFYTLFSGFYPLFPGDFVLPE